MFEEFSRAVMFGDLEKVKAMIAADPNILHSKDKNGFTALHNAMSEDLSETVPFLLENGVNPNVQNDVGIAPLHLACYPENADILLEFGADILLTDKAGNTPLHVLAADGEERYEVIEFLLGSGANPKLKNKAGKTPADISKQRKDRDLLDLFRSC